MPKQLIDKLLKPGPRPAGGAPWPSPAPPPSEEPKGEKGGSAVIGAAGGDEETPAPATTGEERRAQLAHAFLTEGMGMASSLEFHERKDMTRSDWEEIKQAQEAWDEAKESVRIAKPGAGEVTANGEHVRGKMVKEAEEKIRILRGIASYPLTSGSGK